VSFGILRRLQRGLETLYRVDTQLDVRAFVVNESERNRALNDNAGNAGNASAEGGAGAEARRPREQLLVQHKDDELSLALYLDDRTLANLARHDPGRGLHEENFFDFCLAVEGVSHFIYVARCAAEDRQVSALELELQAEVDKFVSCLLCHEGAADDPAELRARLYDRVHYAHDLDRDERARYHTANGEAHRYVQGLERRFLRPQRIGNMLEELRRFYRLSLEHKLGHIALFAA
jgi:hypothetical protein